MDEVLLVTGGSRGIGAATAVLAAGKGYAVAVNYTRNEAAAQEVVRSIRAAGGRAEALPGDVADEAQVTELFAQVDRRFGLTALVNNAGIVDRTSRVEDMSLERLRRMFDVNVIGSILCARVHQAHEHPTWRPGRRDRQRVERRRAAGRAGPVRRPRTSKGAIDTFTIGLAKAGGRRDPGERGASRTDRDRHPRSGGLPNRVRELAHQVPMQRGGSADEVAQAIVWLLSPEASYTTMSLVDVSGGR